MRSQAFYESLPKGPLLQHIGQIHAVMVYMRVDHDSNAFAIAEHSLRQIAVYTQESHYGYPPLRRQPGSDLPSRGASPFVEAVKKAFEDFAAVTAKMRAKQSPEQGEGRAKLRYANRIENERIKAQAFVRATSTRVRAELRDEIHINVPENRSK